MIRRGAQWVLMEMCSEIFFETKCPGLSQFLTFETSKLDTFLRLEGRIGFIGWHFSSNRQNGPLCIRINETATYLFGTCVLKQKSSLQRRKDRRKFIWWLIPARKLGTLRVPRLISLLDDLLLANVYTYKPFIRRRDVESQNSHRNEAIRISPSYFRRPRFHPFARHTAGWIDAMGRLKIASAWWPPSPNSNTDRPFFNLGFGNDGAALAFDGCFAAAFNPSFFGSSWLVFTLKRNFLLANVAVAVALASPRLLSLSLTHSLFFLCARFP